MSGRPVPAVILAEIEPLFPVRQQSPQGRKPISNGTVFTLLGFLRDDGHRLSDLPLEMGIASPRGVAG